MFDTRVSLTYHRRVGGALLVAASLLGGACGESQFTWPEPPQVAARYAERGLAVDAEHLLLTASTSEWISDFQKPITGQRWHRRSSG